MHIPSFRQMEDVEAHSFVSLRQRGPVYPGGHKHEKLPDGELHDPPLAHGLDRQPSSYSHCGPTMKRKDKCAASELCLTLNRNPHFILCFVLSYYSGSKKKNNLFIR